MVSINTKFEGWIEAAHVNYVGQPVSEGDLLFEIFSPQLLTTQQEYLAALQFLERLGEQARPKARQRARALVEAARRRLFFWDVTEDQIKSLETEGKAFRRLKIASPVSGVVVEQAAESLEGMKVSPGMNLYRVADPPRSGRRWKSFNMRCGTCAWGRGRHRPGRLSRAEVARHGGFSEPGVGLPNPNPGSSGRNTQRRWTPALRNGCRGGA